MAYVDWLAVDGIWFTNLVVSGAAALAMFILVTKITGIPYVEDQSIRSRGDLYRDYQQRTSSFVPWFPKLKTEI